MSPDTTDPIRLVVVAGMAFIVGTLVGILIYGVTKPRLREPAAWAAVSVILFIVLVAIYQMDRLGKEWTWRLPTVAAATVFGLVAVRMTAARYKKKGRR